MDYGSIKSISPVSRNYSDISELPLSGNDLGAQALVYGTNRLYIWNGTGWFAIALINLTPNIVVGADSAYDLDVTGANTVIELLAEDPEGIPITWSYAVTTGDLNNTATISQSANVFTITPSTLVSDSNTFAITFSASDGVNIDTSTASFTLEFITSYGINVRTSSGKVTLGMSTSSTSGGGLSADGSNLYVVGYNLDQFFYRWALGTPYKLNTLPASYTERSNILDNNTPTGFYVKPDGTRAFWCDYGTIRWATMSSPNNMSTFGAVSSATSLVPSGLIFGMTFKHDGTSFYIAGTNGVIYQHDVSTPWDPSTKTTGTSGSATFDPSGVQYPFGMFFNYSGTKLFLASDNSTIYEHNLSTPWLISSASNPAVATFSLSTVQSTPLYDLISSGTETRGIFLSTDETKLYLFVRGGNVIELLLNTAGTLADGAKL
jgi:hypothetical protein